jgi:hypothetical protein
MSAHEVEELKTEGNVFGVEIRSAVRSELELILSSPTFAQSNRCKRFLGYVVTQTLAGHASELKERMIGISVFDRANDYDTGGDSIVRVTSNEVRKRIGQFYRESPINHPIQIELPRGSYVPEFRIQPNRKDSETPRFSPDTQLDSTATPIHVELHPIHSAAEQVEDNSLAHPQIDQVEQPRARSSRRIWIGIALVLAVFAIAGVAIGIQESRTPRNFPQIWDSFLHANAPVLICLGTHNLSTTHTLSDEEKERFSDLILHKEMIPVDDVTVISSMASLLGKKGIPFRVIGASQASLTDLRRQPVILIGGANNRWTLRLTQDLRYRIERVDPGSGREPIASIVDSQSPGTAPWTIDFSVPMYSWKSDYAVVARVDDPTTGVPVLIDAGIGSDGSLAASELLASDLLPNQLKSDSSCSGKTNFEAVIETEIIDAKPGPPHVLRLQCW